MKISVKSGNYIPDANTYEQNCGAVEKDFCINVAQNETPYKNIASNFLCIYESRVPGAQFKFMIMILWRQQNFASV